MTDQDVLLEALSRFARLLVTPYDVANALAELVGSVTEALDLSGAGVAVVAGDRLRYVAASSDATAKLEQWQESERTGPCHSAHDTGTVIPVADIRQDTQRWPGYAEVAANSGVLAVAGIPMHLGDEKVGALNIYADRPRSWSDADLAAARVLADMATGYLVFSSTIRHHEQLEVQLRLALENRVIIEQAKGIVARDKEITVEKAFELIRSHARSNSAAVRAVAEAIVRVGMRI